MGASLPGSPTAIHRVASVWRASAAKVAAAEKPLRASLELDWEGEAADAFCAKQRAILPQVQSTAERLQAAAGILEGYATTLTRLDHTYADAHHDAERARARLRSNPLDLVAGLDLAAGALAQRALLWQAQQAADDAARALRGLIGDEVGGSQHWWDPLGWWDDEAIPDENVNGDVLEDTNWDPATVQQGNIGDCYLISTVMGYMRTADGRDLLERNVRWDEKADGYWVTLYVNGQPSEYFVDKIYEHGAEQVDGKTLWWQNTSPNIVSIYEAALAKAITYDDLDDGGRASTTMEMITGQPATYQDLEYSHYDDTTAAGAKALASGSSVVASSIPGDGKIELDDVTVLRPDGSTVVTDVKIVKSHAYEVERIDSDGSVWLRNPWGPENSADGGGLLHLSADQVRTTFAGISFEE